MNTPEPVVGVGVPLFMRPIVDTGSISFYPMSRAKQRGPSCAARLGCAHNSSACHCRISPAKLVHIGAPLALGCLVLLPSTAAPEPTDLKAYIMEGHNWFLNQFIGIPAWQINQLLISFYRSRFSRTLFEISCS
jgi:hypothetical protein